MRVLHISLDTAMGGIESFLLNVYSLIDRDKVQFDFIEYGDVKRDFDFKYTSLGARIYKLPDRRKHPLMASEKLKEILIKESYQVVHIHKNSLSDISAIKVCQSVGVPKIIVHSHNTYRDNKVIVLLHKINQKRLDVEGVSRFACSGKAAEWLFGTTKEVTIVKNGIDTKRFGFDPIKRNEVRNGLKLNDRMVIGNVGRLTEQKNPLFLLEIMRDLQADNSCLLWVGDGELRNVMERKVIEYGIRDKVIFTGAVTNPEDYYQAMDIFVMPSLYEGFPIAAVEAQCAGLPMVLSTQITDEADIMCETEWADINSVADWVKAISEIKGKNTKRKSNAVELQEKGYDMMTTVDFLQKFYITGKM